MNRIEIHEDKLKDISTTVFLLYIHSTIALFILAGIYLGMHAVLVTFQYLYTDRQLEGQILQ